MNSSSSLPRAASYSPAKRSNMRSKQVHNVQIGSFKDNQQELIDVNCGPCGPAEDEAECNACPCCNDTCGISTCSSCIEKIKRPLSISSGQSSWLLGALASVCPAKNEELPAYSMCQLRRHSTVDSAWILVGKDIYDATPYIRSHPGGTAIILKKAGGNVDCSEDMHFHSKRAQKEWRRYKVGTLCNCPRSS